MGDAHTTEQQKTHKKHQLAIKVSKLRNYDLIHKLDASSEGQIQLPSPIRNSINHSNFQPPHPIPVRPVLSSPAHLAGCPASPW